MIKFAEYNEQGNTETYCLLTEAQFSEEKLDKVTSLYGKLFGKKLGGAFKLVFVEDFISADGARGSGYRMFNDKGAAMRFNYERGSISAFNREANANTLIVDSIDYWDADNQRLDRPSLHVAFPKNMNVVKIYDKICKALLRGKPGEFSLNESSHVAESDELNEKANYSEDAELTSKFAKGMNASQRAKFFKEMKAKGHDIAAVSAAKDNRFGTMVKELGLEKELSKFKLTITKGKKEKNTVVKQVKEAEAELKATKRAKTEPVFRDIKNIIKFMIEQNSAKSLLVSGAKGIGKVDTVLQALDKQGANYHVCDSNEIGNVKDLYRTLVTNANRYLVIEELKDLKGSKASFKILLDGMQNRRDKHLVFSYLRGTVKIDYDKALALMNVFSYLDANALSFLAKKPDVSTWERFIKGSSLVTEARSGGDKEQTFDSKIRSVNSIISHQNLFYGLQMTKYAKVINYIMFHNGTSPKIKVGKRTIEFTDSDLINLANMESKEWGKKDGIGQECQGGAIVLALNHNNIKKLLAVAKDLGEYLLASEENAELAVNIEDLSEEDIDLLNNLFTKHGLPFSTHYVESVYELPYLYRLLFAKDDLLQLGSFNLGFSDPNELVSRVKSRIQTFLSNYLTLYLGYARELRMTEINPDPRVFDKDSDEYNMFVNSPKSFSAESRDNVAQNLIDKITKETGMTIELVSNVIDDGTENGKLKFGSISSYSAKIAKGIEIDSVDNRAMSNDAPDAPDAPDTVTNDTNDIAPSQPKKTNSNPNLDDDDYFWMKIDGINSAIENQNLFYDLKQSKYSGVVDYIMMLNNMRTTVDGFDSWSKKNVRVELTDDDLLRLANAKGGEWSNNEDAFKGAAILALNANNIKRLIAVAKDIGKLIYEDPTYRNILTVNTNANISKLIELFKNHGLPFKGYGLPPLYASVLASNLFVNDNDNTLAFKDINDLTAKIKEHITKLISSYSGDYLNRIHDQHRKELGYKMRFDDYLNMDSEFRRAPKSFASDAQKQFMEKLKGYIKSNAGLALDITVNTDNGAPNGKVPKGEKAYEVNTSNSLDIDAADRYHNKLNDLKTNLADIDAIADNGTQSALLLCEQIKDIIANSPNNQTRLYDDESDLNVDIIRIIEHLNNYGKGTSLRDILEYIKDNTDNGSCNVLIKNKDGENENLAINVSSSLISALISQYTNNTVARNDKFASYTRQVTAEDEALSLVLHNAIFSPDVYQAMVDTALYMWEKSPDSTGLSLLSDIENYGYSGYNIHTINSGIATARNLINIGKEKSRGLFNLSVSVEYADGLRKVTFNPPEFNTVLRYALAYRRANKQLPLKGLMREMANERLNAPGVKVMAELIAKDVDETTDASAYGEDKKLSPVTINAVQMYNRVIKDLSDTCGATSKVEIPSIPAALIPDIAPEQPDVKFTNALPDDAPLAPVPSPVPVEPAYDPSEDINSDDMQKFKQAYQALYGNKIALPSMVVNKFSNMILLSDSPVDRAPAGILDNCFVVDIKMRLESLVNRLKTVAANTKFIRDSLDPDEIDSVINEMAGDNDDYQDNEAKEERNVTMESIAMACALKAAGVRAWKRIATNYV